MPRGKPKRGQYALKLWSPKGGWISFDTERDLTEFEWRSSVLGLLDDLRRYVERYAPTATITTGEDGE